jgi:Flp pilus assembly protein TadG
MQAVRARAQGQILPLFAGALLVLILVVGLVIDGGNVFLQQRDSQNGADIGAMAGTKRLADYYVKGTAYTVADNVFTAITTRMTENNCPGTPSNCTWTAKYVGPRTGAGFMDLGPVTAGDTAPPTVSGQKALGVRVDVHRTPQTYLLGIIGQSAWNVNTSATALAGKPTGAPAGQLLPIGLTELPTQEGAVYALTSGSNGPGNFGWVSWDGSNNAGSLATSLCTPNNPAFTLPYEFPGDPGKTNASSVRACLQKWVDNQQTVLIPIVLKSNDPAAPPGCSTGGNGNNFTYCIVAIAAFVITGYAQPAVDQINGRFVGTIPYSMAGNPVVPGPVQQPPDLNSTLYYMGLAQ